MALLCIFRCRFYIAKNVCLQLILYCFCFISYFFIFFVHHHLLILTQATHHRCRDCRFVVATTICFYNSCFYSHFLLVCFLRFVTSFNYLFLRFGATSRINGCRINAQTIVIIRLICTDNGNFLCFLFTVT